MRYLFWICLFALPAISLAQPTAFDDAYEVNVDGILTIGSPGILGNDTVEEGNTMVAVLVDLPVNGSLALNRDGSLTYTPDAGFEGTDTFTYLARTPAVQRVDVDSTVSEIDFGATLSVDFIGDASDASTSRVGGFLFATVNPASAPFDRIHIQDGYLEMLDVMDISFDYNVLGSIDVDAGPKGISLTISEPGPAVPVDNADFNQTDNKVIIQSVMQLNGSGLLGNAVTPGEQTLDTETDQDIPGQVTATDTEIQLHLPLAIAGTFDLEGNEVFVTINGTVDADGPLLLPDDSNIATVTLTVHAAGTGIDEKIAGHWVLEQNYPNPVLTETVIPFGIPRTGRVIIEIYDQLGRTVETLVDATLLPGNHTVTWNGAGLAAGVYLYRMEADGFVETKRLVLL